MSDKAQEMLVEMFRLIERLNGSCSITEARKAARAVRSISFSNEQAGIWLAKFVTPSQAMRGENGRFQVRGPATDRSADDGADHGSDDGTDDGADGSRTGNQAQTDGPRTTVRTAERTAVETMARTEARTASHARDKVLPFKTSTDQSSDYAANAATSLPPDEPAKKPEPIRDERPKRPKREPSERDLAAWALLDATIDIVFEYAPPKMTRSAWRKQNKLGAETLVDAKAEPADVARLLLVAYTHPEASKYFASTWQLATIAKNWDRLERHYRGDTQGATFVWPDTQEHGGRAFMPEALDFDGRAESDAKIMAARAMWETRKAAIAAREAREAMSAC